jgi:hypothetical protein
MRSRSNARRAGTDRRPLRVELLHADEHVEPLGGETVIETLERRVAFGQERVGPLGRADDRVDPSGMARVRKALASGALTGEPSARLGGSMTVKLLRPTETWTPAKAGSARMSASAPMSRRRLPSVSVASGAMPGSMMQSSFASPRLWAASSRSCAAA